MFNVCLVDDDPLILEDIASKEVWHECGFAIVGVYSTPRKALHEIARLRPHAVVCDLRMPEMDGIALMTELRSQGIGCECVMLSAYGSFQDSRDFFLQGGFDYLLKPVDEMELQITLERLARRLFELHGPQESEQPQPHVEGQSAVDAVMAFIQRNYKRKLTLSLLSETFHLSPNYICNLFAKHYGQTFTSVVTSLRMNEAARMIRSTHKALKEIATDCGYANYFYFCRVFKEYHGCTPGDYVCQHRKLAAR